MLGPHLAAVSPELPRGKWTHGGVGCSRWARSTSVSPSTTSRHCTMREVCLADVPVVTHLHGTELLMLEQIDQYIKVTGSRIELPASWTYAEYWAERLRATAAQAHILSLYRPTTPHARCALSESPRIA